MALIAEQVYMVIRDELYANNISAYSDYIPDETTYPFTMYEILLSQADPDTAFIEDYETLTVRFNTYTDKVNPLEAIELSEQIETLFNRTKLSFTDVDNGLYLICNYKVNSSLTYLDEDHYWVCINDYEFKAQRRLSDDWVFSSSSSSSSNIEVEFKSSATTEEVVAVSSIDATKPSGLAVGDLMIANIVGNTGGNITPDIPTGWNQIYSEGFSGRLIAYYKIATIDDVNASSITFNLDTSAVVMVVISAFTNVSSSNPISSVTKGTANAEIVTTASITPETTDSLIVLIGSAATNNATFSDYSIVNDNPTWTELYNIQSSSTAGSLSMAIGQRASASATGLGSITNTGWTGSGTSSSRVTVLFSLNADN